MRWKWLHRQYCRTPHPALRRHLIHLAQSPRCCALLACPAAQSSHRYATACAARFARFLRLASSATGGAQLRNPFRQPPPLCPFPPSGSIGALTRCRSHRLFRQLPSPRHIRHWRGRGYGATGGVGVSEPLRVKLPKRLPLEGKLSTKETDEVEMAT